MQRQMTWQQKSTKKKLKIIILSFNDSIKTIYCSDDYGELKQQFDVNGAVIQQVNFNMENYN